MGEQTPASQFIGLEISRRDFPKDFIFGSATSAYQVEGAYNAYGKSMSNWDTFALERPDKIADGSNGCVAIDGYHRYKEDILHMKGLGLSAYRFSISWSRILPGGRLSSGINLAGIQYYNDLIDFCLSQGIEPFVTIFHFELPQCLEDEYGGFLSPKIIEDFADLAIVCFRVFGDRVKYWITVNEPLTFTVNGYVLGSFPPGRGASPVTEHRHSSKTGFVAHRGACQPGHASAGTTVSSSEGDAGTEPYIVAHHLLLCHAKAVSIYRNLYQAAQGGKIGITNVTTWYEPLNPEDPEDTIAAERAVDFGWGWFTSPIVHGDYPPIMRELVGKRLPKFTAEQVKQVQGSYDFIGMNYYTTFYAANSPTSTDTPTYYTDQNVLITPYRNNVKIGDNPGGDWFFIVPRGIYSLLTHIKDKYNDPEIYITEQGICTKNDPKLTPMTGALQDYERVGCYANHLAYVKKAIDEHVKVKSYFLWSIFDNFEWAEGYTVRFGIFYIDFEDGLRRYHKHSALWWRRFLAAPTPYDKQAKRLLAITEETSPSSDKRLKSGRDSELWTGVMSHE